jgi:hypothetical protein
MKVWLIDHTSGFPSGSEGRSVKSGIKRNLENWFRQVARHRTAVRDRPTGEERRIDVDWSDTASAAGPIDIVLHFVPSQEGAHPPVMGPYREAAAELRNRELSEGLANMRRGVNGGRTYAATEGSNRVPTLSLVIVLYDGQFETERSRVRTNVETLSIVAFHEAAHNKDRENALHRDGGGGIFGDIHTSGASSATSPNRNNIAFFAERIWNWGPQYYVGGTLNPVRPPSP